jgi:hypothetical protein
MQFQADILLVTVARPVVIETSALWAAYLTELAIGLWSLLEEIAKQWQIERRFEPTLGDDEQLQRLNHWHRENRFHDIVGNTNEIIDLGVTPVFRDQSNDGNGIFAEAGIQGAKRRAQFCGFPLGLPFLVMRGCKRCVRRATRRKK